MKAKKCIIPLLLCLLIIGITVFLVSLPNRPDGTIDIMELGEVAKFSKSELENRLVGELRENIITSWGDPNSIITEQDAVSYDLPNGDKYKCITLFYDNNAVVDIVVE